MDHDEKDRNEGQNEPPERQDDKPHGEQQQRPKDLDPKDKGEDVKGGAFRAFSDARLKRSIRPL